MSKNKILDDEIQKYLYDSHDEDGNWIDRDFFNDPEITIMQKHMEDGVDDQWWPENIVFKWKDKYYSVINNKASYNGNIEWEYLEEVVPKEVTKIVYEVL